MFKTFLFSNSKFVFILILLTYIVFPTNNSSVDAYAYAAYIKYNQFLFTPHHLFSNAFLYLLLFPFKTIGIQVDILFFSKIINSIFQLINLLILYKILAFLKIKEKLSYIIILAFSFSLWRYGTENETYIIPITFSLLGSFYFLKNISNSKNIYLFLSGFFATIACLFHQIHFFWWLGLFVGFYFYNKRFKTLFLYAISALLVPVSYILVLVFYEKQELGLINFLHFVFHDFYQGSVMTNFGWKGLFFQLLNSVRTFFQLHPNIYIMIKSNFLFIAPLIFSLIISFLIFKQLKKEKNFVYKKNNSLNIFIKVHIFILLSNYFFAFYNYGNIEFMVMLPYLLCLVIVIKYHINTKLLQLFGALLFVWNFSFGIFPNYNYNYYNDDKLVEFMIKNPEKTFLIKNATALNHYFYETGIDNAKNVVLFHKISEKELIQIIKNKNEIYTDVISKPEILNKAKMIACSLDIDFNEYKKDKVFSYDGFYGTSTLYKISKE